MFIVTNVPIIFGIWHHICTCKRQSKYKLCWYALCQHTKSNLFYVNEGVDLVYIHNKSNVSKHIGNYLACPNKYKNVNDMLYVNYLCIYCMCWKIFIWIQSIDTYMYITWKQVWTMEKNIIEVYKFQVLQIHSLMNWSPYIL